MQQLVAKNLVRWDGDGAPELGTVLRVEQNGSRVVVRLDSGAIHTFVWPSETLERVLLEAGQHARVLASDEVGLITLQRVLKGLALYQVSTPSGAKRTVIEDGIRPATIADPVERLRAGELHSARATNLRVAGTRLLYAYQHDELSTLGNSRVEIKPHQVGVIHRVASSYPHRFILADEVGLGKTIEAGLLIRELQARGVAKRVLVLAPSGLTSQWQQELKTKFNLTFSLFNSDSLRWLRSQNPDENPWAQLDQVIASTPFASWNDDRRKEIAQAGWDMVIIDEAHHARRTYQGRSKFTSTNAYRLAEQLADPDVGRAQAMLLLTATPMQLHRFELYSLIELLDPALFPTFDDFDQHANELRGLNATVERVKRFEALRTAERDRVLDAVEHWFGDSRAEVRRRIDADRGAVVDELYDQHRLSKVMVRNRKSVVGGFMKRTAAIWEVDLSPQERAAYDAVTRYVQTGFARSKAVNNNALGFLMATFQKLNASSSYALKRSLMRRIEKLEKVTEEHHRDAILDDYELDELPTSMALDSLLEQRMDADWEEVRELERLVERLEAIPRDTKTEVLLRNLETIAGDDADAKVIIFTQFRDTQDYLREHIPAPWTVHLFHGQLNPQEKDASVAQFRDYRGPRILLSTEAGGEGRNFQYCHIMVNYDLPWNPMKVEQRIGRIDRIGQKKPVTVFNFSTLGTIEERVVDVLTERIGVFTETIGGLDPILGEVEGDLRKIFLMAETEAAAELASLQGRLQRRVQAARVAEEQLADLIMDSRSYRKDEVADLLAKPRSVDQNDLKRFVLNALADLGVEIKPDREHRGVHFLRFNSRFEKVVPDEMRVGHTRRVTFDLSVALEREEITFLAFGHPIVDGLVEHVTTREFGGITSHRIVGSNDIEPADGWYFVYSLQLRGLVAAREMLPVFVHADGRPDLEVGQYLLNRTMTGRREDFSDRVGLPDRGDPFEEAVATAESLAVDRLLARQAEMEATNVERLVAERAKRERFYDYRSQAAADRLVADERIVDRLRASQEDDERRILPVWEKRVEQSRRMVELVEEERVTQLAELAGRENVAAQHELFTASYVTIEPDPVPLFDEVRRLLRNGYFEAFKVCCRRVAPEEFGTLRSALVKRRADLKTLSTRHAFDIALAISVADALVKALGDVNRLRSNELTVLWGAASYFLKIHDDVHDLKSDRGFEDDALVVNAVFTVIGMPELRTTIHSNTVEE